MIRALAILALALAGMPAPAAEAAADASTLQPVPALRARVTDLTGSLSADAQGALEAKLTEFEQRKGAQVAVLIVASTAPESIEQYSIRVVEAWQLGRKHTDDGVLLLLAKDDRQLRIEVGRGLEGALTDATTSRIIDEQMVPVLRQGNLTGAINAGVDAILRVIDGEPLPPPDRRWQRNGNLRGLLPFLIVGFLVVSQILSSLFGRTAGAVVTGGVIGLAVWLFAQVLLLAAGAAIVAFLIALFGGGGGGRGWSAGPRGGGWFGGGLGGGGFGGGGFGGGFGGGGGGFAGGGASGAVVNRFARLWRHFLRSFHPARYAFPPGALAAIEAEIAAAERGHGGEIRFAVENVLSLPLLLRGTTPRARALSLFAALGIWDTVANNGVLIYVLLADRSVEIVADRGIAARVPETEWRLLCREIEPLFGRGEFEAGARAAIRGVASHLGRHFPRGTRGGDELPNQPVLL